MRTAMEKQEYVRDMTEAIRRRDEKPQWVINLEEKEREKEINERRHKS